MLIHHQTIVIRVNNVIKIIIRTNNSFSQKLRKYIPEAPVVGIDFRKFLLVACVETLLVVRLNRGKGGRNQNGFRWPLTWQWSNLLGGDSARFQLRLAHLELEKDNHGGWLAGRGSSTSNEDKLQLDLAWAERWLATTLIGIGIGS